MCHTTYTEETMTKYINNNDKEEEEEGEKTTRISRRKSTNADTSSGSEQETGKRVKSTRSN